MILDSISTIEALASMCVLTTFTTCTIQPLGMWSRVHNNQIVVKINLLSCLVPLYLQGEKPNESVVEDILPLLTGLL